MIPKQKMNSSGPAAKAGRRIKKASAGFKGPPSKDSDSHPRGIQTDHTGGIQTGHTGGISAAHPGGIQQPTQEGFRQTTQVGVSRPYRMNSDSDAS